MYSGKVMRQATSNMGVSSAECKRVRIYCAYIEIGRYDATALLSMSPISGTFYYSYGHVAEDTRLGFRLKNCVDSVTFVNARSKVI